MVLALYPGSFDPVTMGHVDIAERAAALFDGVVVGIYEAPPKQLLFSTQERVALMKKALKHIPNAKVVSYEGLTVEFARKMKAKVIVRGLRMSSDFEKEFEKALMKKKLATDIEVNELLQIIQDPLYFLHLCLDLASILCMRKPAKIF